MTVLNLWWNCSRNCWSCGTVCACATRFNAGNYACFGAAEPGSAGTNKAGDNPGSTYTGNFGNKSGRLRMIGSAPGPTKVGNEITKVGVWEVSRWCSCLSWESIQSLSHPRITLSPLERGHLAFSGTFIILHSIGTALATSPVLTDIDTRRYEHRATTELLVGLDTYYKTWEQQDRQHVCILYMIYKCLPINSEGVNYLWSGFSTLPLLQ